MSSANRHLSDDWLSNQIGAKVSVTSEDEMAVLSLVAKRIFTAIFSALTVAFVFGAIVFMLGEFVIAPIPDSNVVASVWVRVVAAIAFIIAGIVTFVTVWKQ